MGECRRRRGETKRKKEEMRVGFHWTDGTESGTGAVCKCAKERKRERPPSDKVEIKDVEFRVTSQSFWFMDEGDG